MDWTEYNFYYLKDEDGVTDLPDTDGIKLVMENGQVWSVPSEPTNRHWQMYQAWLADGHSTQSE
jgi:hypothetical protein